MGRLIIRPTLVLVAGGLVLAAGVGMVAWPAVVGSVDGDAARVEGEVPATAMHLGSSRAVTSPVLARDPTSPAFVAAATRRDAPGPGCDLLVSGTDGADWLPVEAIGELPEGLGACYAPDVGFDSQGRLVFSFVGMAGPPPQPAGVWVVASDDHAQSFTQPRQLTEAATTATSLAVGDDGLTLAWLQPPAADAAARGWPVGRRVMVASGDVGGLGEPQPVADPEGLVAAPRVASGPQAGTVVAYYELASQASVDQGAVGLVEPGAWRLMVARRPAGRDEFDEPVPVGEIELVADEPSLVSRRGVAAPSVAVGAGRTCVAWTDVGEAGLDAWVRCAANGTDQWGQPAQLGASLAGETFQWLPQITVTDTGRIAAVFYHHRQPAADARAVDAYYTAAEDPAGGFDEPRRVSSRSSHPQRAPVPGWFGTQLGLAAGNGQAVAMWTDSRHGIPQAYPSQTLMAARLAMPDRAPPWLQSAGAVLAGGGLLLAGAGVWWRRRAASDTEEVDAAEPSPRELAG